MRWPGHGTWRTRMCDIRRGFGAFIWTSFSASRVLLTSKGQLWSHFRISFRQMAIHQWLPAYTRAAHLWTFCLLSLLLIRIPKWCRDGTSPDVFESSKIRTSPTWQMGPRLCRHKDTKRPAFPDFHTPTGGVGGPRIGLIPIFDLPLEFGFVANLQLTGLQLCVLTYFQLDFWSWWWKINRLSIIPTLQLRAVATHPPTMPNMANRCGTSNLGV